MEEATPKDLDPAVAAYYHRAPEEDRLEQGPLPGGRPPACVSGVGGGPEPDR